MSESEPSLAALQLPSPGSDLAWWLRTSPARLLTALLHVARASRTRTLALLSRLAGWARAHRKTALLLALALLGLDLHALLLFTQRRRRRLVGTMAQCSTYEEWSEAREELRVLDSARNGNGKKPPTSLCSPPGPETFRELAHGVSLLNDLRAGRLPDHLRSDMWTSLRAGIAGAASYVSAAALDGDEDPDAARTLRELRDVCRTLMYDVPPLSWPASERALLLREALQVCGTYALALSGGGMLSAFHVGVVYTLQKQGLLPRVLSGSSGGAIVAAVVCTRDEAELVRFFETWPHIDAPLTKLFMSFFGAHSLRERMRNLLLRTGFMLPSAGMRNSLRLLLGDLTFAEAHERSGRVLNVSVSGTRPGEQPRLLNHLTAGEVLVWSAVAVSCAFPGLYAPMPLLAKRNGQFVHWLSPGAPAPDLLSTSAASGFLQRHFRDGSVDADIPRHALSQLFNVNTLVVSAANPWIWIVLRLRALPLARRLVMLLEGEIQHLYQQSVLLLSATGATGGLLAFARDLAGAAGQEWQGDITIARAPTLRNILASVSNPSAADLAVAFLRGQRATWNHLTQLRAMLGSLQCIETATRELSRQAQLERNRRRLGGGSGVAARPGVLSFDQMTVSEGGTADLLSPGVVFLGDAQPGAQQ